MTPALWHAIVAFGAAFGAGAINSVAGGGTLVSFPALVWLGLPSITANATSTVAIWPGSLGGMWGFRDELRTASPRLLMLAAPSIVGGLVGALLLRMTPTSLFDRLVPLLILFATVLFAAQGPIQRVFRIGDLHDEDGGLGFYRVMAFQLLIGLYGGYFGAGIGILMLAALSIIGLSDIHQMNALKNMLALCINGVAAVYFVAMGMVSWPDVVLMAIGAIAGGIGGAGVARRIGRQGVRRIVIGIGLVMGLSMVWRR